MNPPPQEAQIKLPPDSIIDWLGWGSLIRNGTQLDCFKLVNPMFQLRHDIIHFLLWTRFRETVPALQPEFLPNPKNNPPKDGEVALWPFTNGLIPDFEYDSIQFFL